MKIYIVARMVDREDEQSSATVSAHVDKGRADAAAKAIDARREDLIYGVVETVELDLSNLGGNRDARLDMLNALTQAS